MSGRPSRKQHQKESMHIKLAYGRGESRVQFPEDTPVDVAQVLQSIKDRAPDIYDRWCDKDGRLRSSLNVFVDGEHIRYRKGMETLLKNGDEVYIIPIIAGG